MQKIKITTDSTCDLSKKMIEKYDIGVLPLSVILDEEYFDGVNVQPKDIFEYVGKTNLLPKTAARSRADFNDFFQKYIDEGYTIVHIGIGSELSASYRNVCAVADELGAGKVYPVDSRTLSTGSGLLLIHAAELIQKGKSAEEIARIESERAFSIQASFVVDRLDYLYKGGRCSALAMFGANLLKLKPRLQVVDGKLAVTEKYRGKMIPVLEKYIDDTLQKYPNPDNSRVFITHSSADKDVVDAIAQYLASKNIFKEVLVTTAGSVITSHCGKGTLGILYINDGGRR